MSHSAGFHLNNQMGSCISSQSRAEKQSLGSRGKSAVPTRKAVMDRYPVSTKCRPGVICTENSSPTSAMTATSSSVTETQMRSKLRPPSVGIGRPHSIHVSKMTDSNGNIARPSSLPRLRVIDAHQCHFSSPKLEANSLIKANFLHGGTEPFKSHHFKLLPMRIPSSAKSSTPVRNSDEQPSNKSLCGSPSLSLSSVIFIVDYQALNDRWSGLFNMGIPHIPHIKLLWGKKIIKYGLNMVFHWKSIKNSEKKTKNR